MGCESERGCGPGGAHRGGGAHGGGGGCGILGCTAGGCELGNRAEGAREAVRGGAGLWGGQEGEQTWGERGEGEGLRGRKGLRGRGCSAGTAPGGGAEGRGPPTHGRRTGSRCGRARLQASRPAPALTHPAAPRGAPQLRTPSRPTDSSLDPAPSPMPRLGAVFLPVPRLLSILCAPPPKAGAWRGVTIGAAPHAPRCRGARSREDGGALGVGGGSGTGRGDASGGRAAVRRLELGSGRGEERGGGSRAEGSGRRPPHGPPSSSPGCSGTSFVPVPPLFSPPPSPRFQGNPDVWAQLRIAQPCCSARCFLSLHALLPAASASHPCRICIAVPGCCCCCSGGAGGGQEGGRRGGLLLSLEPCCVHVELRRVAAGMHCVQCGDAAGVRGCRAAVLWGAVGERWVQGCRQHGSAMGAGMQAPWGAMGCNGDALVQGCRHHGGAMGMHWCRDCRHHGVQWGCVGAGMLAPRCCLALLLLQDPRDPLPLSVLPVAAALHFLQCTERPPCSPHALLSPLLEPPAHNRAALRTGPAAVGFCPALGLPRRSPRRPGGAAGRPELLSAPPRPGEPQRRGPSQEALGGRAAATAAGPGRWERWGAAGGAGGARSGAATQIPPCSSGGCGVHDDALPLAPLGGPAVSGRRR